MATDKISSSYMEMCLRLDGKNDLYLRIPTVWDAEKNQWIGFFKTPVTKKLIHGEGKDSFELQNSLNIAVSQVIQDPEYSDEIFSMFKAKEYWER